MVYVKARAEDGQANRDFLRAVSDWLGVPGSSVRIRRGARGREKLVEVDGRTALEVERALHRVADSSSPR